jgi:hypothetical protein
VVLEVFDLFGQKVQTLVNQQQGAGQYSISFDGRALSSGVYVYKIKTTHFQQANKMLLLR